VFIERRSSHPELPLHLLDSRRRSGAYLMMLLLGTALFAVFFFLTIYIQTVWGYSAVRAGLAWLPFPIAIIAINVLVARSLVQRIGVRPLVIIGPLLATVGYVWLSNLSETGGYWSHLFAPMMVLAAGLGFMFVPITLMVVSHVANQEQGAASGLLNTGQQIGGAIGLAAIGSVAWTSVANSITSQMASGAGATAAATGAAASDATPAVPTSVLFSAMTTGFSTGLLVASGVVFAAFVVALVSTWTPGWRLVSARHDGEQSCDEALGTCDAVGA
jgi:predicted MFS family arabinose efflux permease